MTETESGGAPGLLSCPECGTRLAFDQRYCIACGARRRRTLGAGVAQLRSRLSSRGRVASLSRASEAVFAPLTECLPGWAATPRAAAAAVLGMLGFGVIVGSMVGAGVAGVLRPAMILVEGGGNSSASPGQNAGAVGGGGGGYGGGGGSGGGGGAKTIIETITHTSGGGGVGGGGGGGSTTGQSTTTPTSPAPSTPTGIPPIKHVFLIMLSDQGYYQTFASNNAYFGKQLPKQGEVVPFYYGVTQGELANQVGLLSGQGPTQQTAANCPKFTRFSASGHSKYKELLGSGCVYPSSVRTLPEQLASGKHGGWKAYIQGLGTTRNAVDARRRRTEAAGSSTTGSSTAATSAPPPPCAHPALGASDSYATATKTDPYVTWRNPLVYFQSVIDKKSCQKLDVSLSELTHDLKSKKTTPALSYISPDPCDDGSDQPCHSGAPAGLAPAQKFLKTVLPEIEHSPAYKANGLIIITFDQAPQSGPDADSSSCCDQPTYPNIPATSTSTTTTDTSTGTTTTSTAGAGTTTTGTGSTGTGPGTGTTGTGTTGTGTGTATTGTGTTTTGTTPTTTPPATGSPGGGQVGLLLISKYVKPGSQDALDYFNHFSLLGSLEKIFKLPRLGYAQDPALSLFSSALFNASS